MDNTSCWKRIRLRDGLAPFYALLIYANWIPSLDRFALLLSSRFFRMSPRVLPGLITPPFFETTSFWVSNLFMFGWLSVLLKCVHESQVYLIGVSNIIQVFRSFFVLRLELKSVKTQCSNYAKTEMAIHSKSGLDLRI